MKILCFLLFVFISSLVFAQKLTPQWLMPLFFQDGNGDRDTVYIGYDPRASGIPEDIDTIFDEGWEEIDTTKFNVILWQYPGAAPVGEWVLISNLVRKTDIKLYLSADIGFINGKMPITVKWVDSLLYSTSLPYKDISPRPRARIDWYCFDGNPAYWNCPRDFPLSLTNYVTPDLVYPVTDSLFLDGEDGYYNPYRSIGNTSVSIVQHNLAFVPVKQTDAKPGVVFPNPFSGNITVTNVNECNTKISIVNTSGVVVFDMQCSGSIICLLGRMFWR